jgi:hypothetical protein
MPTATPFTALGRGNGFPFCLIVATEEEIAALASPSGNQDLLRYDGTLTEVMDIFCNIYEFVINISTSVGVSAPQTNEYAARLGGNLPDYWFESYGFYPLAESNPSISPTWRNCITEQDDSAFGLGNLISYHLAGGFATSSPVGAYGNTNADAWGDPAYSGSTGDFDLPDQESAFFEPNYYYNTTSGEYCILWSSYLGQEITLEGTSDGIFLQSQYDATFTEVNMTMFGKDYTMYGDYGSNSPNGSIIVTSNDFTY